MDPLSEFMAMGVWASFIGMIFMFIMAIIWFILPFAIFGIKGRLDTLIGLNEDLLENVEELNAKIKKKEASK